MPKIFTNSLMSAAAAACLLSPPAMADDTGFYVGANVGRVLSTYHRNDLDRAVTADFGGAERGFVLGPSSIEKKHAMWTADAGYMFTRNFGIEASYLHLGSLAYSSFGTEPAVSGAGTTAVSVNLAVRSHGPALAVTGVLPMSNFWELDARVGGYEAKTTTAYESTIGEQVKTGRVSATSTSLLGGFGTAVTLSSHCTVRLDYVRLEHIKEGLLGHTFNVDLLTVGMALVF